MASASFKDRLAVMTSGAGGRPARPGRPRGVQGILVAPALPQAAECVDERFDDALSPSRASTPIPSTTHMGGKREGNSPKYTLQMGTALDGVDSSTFDSPDSSCESSEIVQPRRHASAVDDGLDAGCNRGSQRGPVMSSPDGPIRARGKEADGFECGWEVIPGKTARLAGKRRPDGSWHVRCAPIDGGTPAEASDGEMQRFHATRLGVALPGPDVVAGGVSFARSPVGANPVAWRRMSMSDRVAWIDLDPEAASAAFLASQGDTT